MKIGMILLSLSACIVAAPALAHYDDKGRFYVGAGVGETHPSLFGKEEVSWDMHGGYSLSENFAIEGGYWLLGRESLPDNRALEVSGLATVVVAKLPVAETVDVFAEAGLYFWKVSVVEDRWDRYSEVNDGADFLYGVGMSFAVANHVDVVAKYRSIAMDLVEEDVTNLGVGVRYTFH